jgi:hypothetical protein
LGQGRENVATLEKWTNDARMLLKTKGHCGELPGEAGMCLKTIDLFVKSGNVVENKGT